LFRRKEKKGDFRAARGKKKKGKWVPANEEGKKKKRVPPIPPARTDSFEEKSQRVISSSAGGKKRGDPRRLQFPLRGMVALFLRKKEKKDGQTFPHSRGNLKEGQKSPCYRGKKKGGGCLDPILVSLRRKKQQTQKGVSLRQASRKEEKKGKEDQLLIALRDGGEMEKTTTPKKN